MDIRRAERREKTRRGGEWGLGKGSDSSDRPHLRFCQKEYMRRSYPIDENDHSLKNSP